MKKPSTRFVLFLLVLCLALPMTAAAEEPSDVFVVASTTGMSGEFMAGMWGNNTTDVDVRILLHDYPTTYISLDETVSINDMAVRRHAVSTDEAGNAVHTFMLRDDLLFSDGSRITAKDYVFTVLLESSPLIRELGGTNVGREHLVGAEAYTSGEAMAFAGVRLLGDLEFSLTIKKEFLPYFYELDYVTVQPYPVAVIAPGCRVADDGQGAYMDGGFTAELLQKTILDPETGYKTHPRVSSGAYRMVGCDRINRVAEFERNPYYIGNRDRKKPSIPRIRLREIKNDEVPSALVNGEVQLVNKISSADVIDAVREIPGDLVKNAAYPRNGLAYIHFSGERAITSSPTFRKALIRLLDRKAVIDQFLRNYGEEIYAYYGMGQWMVKDMRAKLPELNKHPYDPEMAAELLDMDGWTLNSEGKAYDPQADSIRYKKFDEELVPLTLRMGLTPDNQAAETVLALFRENLQQAGGSLEIEYMSMPELLRQYYRQDEREYDLLFLATNFGYVFDPYPTYHTEDEFQGIRNRSGLRDEELMGLAKEMRQTEPGDKATFLERWFAFQQHWTEMLPLLPIYSNTYYDAFDARLTNYHPERYFSWADAILYVTLKK